MGCDLRVADLNNPTRVYLYGAGACSLGPRGDGLLELAPAWEALLPAGVVAHVHNRYMNGWARGICNDRQ